VWFCQSAPNPILTTMRNFPEAWEARLQWEECLPQFALREALAEAIEVQGREPVGEEQRV
jgi:[NiFe] hydrogenase diaphorase moiety large subunit